MRASILVLRHLVSEPKKKQITQLSVVNFNKIEIWEHYSAEADLEVWQTPV